MQNPFKPATLAERMMKYAEDHYADGGWDVIVECYSLEDLAELIAGALTFEAALVACEEIVDVFQDRQLDAVNSAF